MLDQQARGKQIKFACNDGLSPACRRKAYDRHNGLKGLAQAKIIKKSVILFRVLYITI